MTNSLYLTLEPTTISSLAPRPNRDTSTISLIGSTSVQDRFSKPSIEVIKVEQHLNAPGLARVIYLTSSATFDSTRRLIPPTINI